ncbi:MULTISPECIES: hypothetical protein [Bacillota]|uniref:hypothetical protein n=1 Tax=Bacillota TaxID=1239 RepID=UPI0039F02E5A
MRLRDILTEEEDQKVQDLKMELLDAHNEKERQLILEEIKEIFETAKRRFYSNYENKEQAASVELGTTYPIIHEKSNEQVMQ